MILLGQIFFYISALLAVGGAGAVVLSKNPIRAAMGLLLLILSIAGLFASLHAQFLAAVQLIVYAGAIVVLFLFVIMLLGPSASTPADGRGAIVRTIGGGLFGLTGLLTIAAAVRASMGTPSGYPVGTVDGAYGGIDAFGAVLFSDAIIPFELSSALLMVAVVGAIGVARGRQGVGLTKNERESVASVPEPSMSPTPHSGLYSHESHGSQALVDAPAHGDYADHAATAGASKGHA
ncbi:MAG TPA: NADH-quinone oxidoreductase subunit J [Polyangiaceae bacterium]|nr:NADH-quinone oxidoreductase subunit J [Polyangiaceae bacterium]